MLTKNDITSAVVENWLADFEQALAAPSDAGLRALFPPDCHWRDVLALTWTIQTLGRPSYAPLVRYRSFEYQAASWDRPRRVIAKIEHHLGELFPRVDFIVTTLTGTNRAVVRFYNQHGTAEQWIKEGKTATHWTRLSCHRFRANEVRLLLGVIAYNLGNLLRRLVLPVSIQNWSLTSLQQRLFKTGGRLIRHARYFTLHLAESYLTRLLFRQIHARIQRLAWHST